MKPVNLPAGSQRNSDVGLLWREVITASSGTISVFPQGSIRVAASADTTVTIGGVLVMTVRAGKDIIINVGMGLGTEISDGRRKVDVVIAGAADVQIAEESDNKARRTP